MASALLSVLEARRATKTPAFVAYLTAGFPTPAATVPCLLALQAAGADVIELGLPYSDPTADGTTIQRASEVALKHNTNLKMLFELVAEAKAQGLKTPLVVMGYYNPMRAYGIDKLAADSAAAGISGFIIVDLAPEEGVAVLDAFSKHKLSYIPLVTPVTTEERMKQLCTVASTFVYCVSVTGVTGQREKVADDVGAMLTRLRAHTKLPLCVGFGISTREHVESIAKLGADGTIVGSAIINAIEAKGLDAKPEELAAVVTSLVSTLTANATSIADPVNVEATTPDGSSFKGANAEYVFGAFGGRYIPETLVQAHEELQKAWDEAKADPEYLAELDRLRREYVGGPTPLWYAKRLTEFCGGAKIWLKREDLAHTGAHKINNALGQVLLAKRLGKPRVIAETGAGQHGVATATACALLGVDCTVYMGEEDTERQSLNVFRMKVLGTKVVPVTSGSRTLKDAINEAMRDWVSNVRTTHYCVGSAIGPHPFPRMVRDLQSVLGKEARQHMLDQAGALPDHVVACVGGGSNAIGIFYPFVKDEGVKLVGAEAGGKGGVEGGSHSATLVAGTPGVLHGCMTYLLQDEQGQCKETHSISAGLDYPGVGPEHAFLKDSARAEYVVVNDGQAMDAFYELSRQEGIIPALETAHAVYAGMEIAKREGKDKHVLINLSGRGDKDMLTVAKVMGVTIKEAL